MTLKELEEQIKHLRDLGATDDTEMVVYDPEWEDGAPIRSARYSKYGPNYDSEEHDPVIVFFAG